MVRISAFHADGPGSIPGRGVFFRVGYQHIHIAVPRESRYTTRLFRLAVRTSRCGRDNPGSNPGRDIL